MPSPFDDAKNLVNHAQKRLDDIRGRYESSLADKEIDPELPIEIKNLMENLRSALDFSAQALHSLHGSGGENTPKIYFPYALAGQTETQFRNANRMEICISGLAASRPKIAQAIEGFQAFSDAENSWLPQFMDLNNENKHRKLSPQTRTETKELKIESGPAQMRMGPGAVMKIAPGAEIRLGGGAVIRGGQTFGPDNPPKMTGPGRVEVTTWVTVVFDHNGEPVVPFLEKAVEGVEAIVDTLSKM